MAGHSKWANIKHKKAKEDAKRGKIFTKLIREITVAARLGGGDVNSNPRLRAAVQAALAGNMTRDTIDRAVKRGAGGEDGANVEEIRYEGYGVSGVAVMVDCMTDNRNRSVAEVRHVFSKCGGNLGTDGSVSYLFSKQGIISFAPGVDEDQLMELALESGADDVISQADGAMDVVTTPEQFADVLEAIQAAGLEPVHAEVMEVASTEVTLTLEDAQKTLKMIDMLEDLDDVQQVSKNADIPPDVLEALQSA